MRLLRNPLTSRVRLYQSALIAILFAGMVIQSEASIYTIGARDTSLQIDLAGGLSQWTIDGVNQLNLQSLYYSVGSGPTASIYTIGIPSAPSITTNLSHTTVSLDTAYANSTLGVDTLFSLQSSPVGSGKATLAETFTINNLSATTQVFHFYQYSDFDLGGVLGGQSVQFSSNGSGQQYQVVQTDSNGRTLTGLITGVTGGSSAQSEVQAALYDGTQFGLGSVNPVTLNNTLTAGPGNVDYAYEWDATLAAGSSLTISEIQAVVPEPSSVALVVSGMLALALFHRRWQGGQRTAVLVRA
jgi:hypothetical protein